MKIFLENQCNLKIYFNNGRRVVIDEHQNAQQCADDPNTCECDGGHLSGSGHTLMLGTDSVAALAKKRIL